MTQPPYPPPPGPQPAWPPPPAWPQQPPPSGPWPPAARQDKQPAPPLGCAAAAGAVIIAVIVLVAVAATRGSDTTEPPAASRTRAALTDADITRTAMLTTIRAKYPKYQRLPDAQIVELGETACAALRAGNSHVAVGITLATHARIPLDEAGYLIGAFTVGLCPDQRSKIPAS